MHLIAGWQQQWQCDRWQAFKSAHIGRGTGWYRPGGPRPSDRYLAHGKLPSVGGKLIPFIFDPTFEDGVMCRSGPIRAQGVGAGEQARRVEAERPV
jgi:hypothetical protein